MDKRVLIVVGVILLMPMVLLGIWAVQGHSMEGDFAEALSAGTVRGLQRDLQNKQWSPAELATIEVLKVPAGAGQERAIARTLQARGRIFVSAIMYEFQATVCDNTTGIVHVFGYRRAEPHHWCWDRFHPDSMQTHLQRPMEEEGKEGVKG